MGWLGKALGALGGAATGFITSGGNPLGAIAGGIGALAGGGESGRASRTTTQTQRSQPRAWTPQEQAIIDQIQTTMPGMLEGMSPEAQESLLQRLYQSSYEPAAQGINQAFDRYGSQQDALAMRRGVGGSTTSQAHQATRLGERGRALGAASGQATAFAEAGLGSRMASQRAGLGASQGVLDSMNRMRMGGAGVTSTLTTPNTTMTDAMAGLGGRLGDPGSWINTTGRDMLGGATSAVGGWLGLGGNKKRSSPSMSLGFGG